MKILRFFKSRKTIALIALFFLLSMSIIVIRVGHAEKKGAYNYATAVSEFQSAVVKEKMEIAMQTAANLASVSQAFGENQSPERSDYIRIMQSILEDQPEIFGLWAVWEPNAFDGQDSSCIEVLGSDGAGRFVPYVHREGKLILTNICHGYAEVGHDTYYTLPKETGKPQIMEPYQCMAGDVFVSMTSLAIPLYRDGKFVGVAGADFQLADLQKIVVELAPMDKGYGFLLSNQGTTVAHRDPRFIGENLQNHGHTAKDLTFVKEGKALQTEVFSEFLQTKSIRVFTPIAISGTETPWSFVVTIPMQAVMQTRNETIIITVIATIFAMLLFLLAIAHVSKTTRIETQVQDMAERNIALESEQRKLNQAKEELAALYEETAAINSELEQQIAAREKAYFSSIFALARAIEAKDPYTRGHCERVTQYAVAIAHAMGLDSPTALEDIRNGSMLHDIGKIAIPEIILNKPASLTGSEMAIIRSHPVKGYEMCRGIDFLSGCMNLILQHHERFDGLGYPAGAKGDNIDLYARIVCVADAYDAMTSTRSYRSALSPDEALKELIDNAGTQFDPKVVDAFHRIFPEL